MRRDNLDIVDAVDGVNTVDGINDKRAVTAAAFNVAAMLLMTVLAVVPTTSTAVAQGLREARQLTSNNVIALAGSGDTLWVATERGFNYRTSVHEQDGWLGFEANDLQYRFLDMAFGGGGVAALLYNNSETSADYIGFWHFDHRTGQNRERYFRFPAELRDEKGAPPNPTGGMIYANGCFWVPFGVGGMVRYDPVADNIRAIRLGYLNEVHPSNMDDYDPDDNYFESMVVLSLANYGRDEHGNEGILVTMPLMFWVYYPARTTGEKWVEINKPGSQMFDGQPPWRRLSNIAAFTLPKKDAPSALYALMAVQSDERVDTTLLTYADGSGTWFRALDSRSNIGIYPAGNSAMHVVSDNRVRLFADTLSAGSGRDNHLHEILTHEKFRQLLAAVGDNASPEVNDILFLPRDNSRSAGTLVVATTTGLYISASVEPLAGDYGEFQLIRHVREVKPGQAYALPGIIRSSMDDRYDRSTFVYKLRKDGDVTIRVYDYNMSLVRTVVSGERRRSGAERSTVPDRDFWDGTNNLGRRVWPGVYYFKITSTGGDRFLGKVILAK